MSRIQPSAGLVAGMGLALVGTFAAGLQVGRARAFQAPPVRAALEREAPATAASSEPELPPSNPPVVVSTARVSLAEERRSRADASATPAPRLEAGSPWAAAELGSHEVTLLVEALVELGRVGEAYDLILAKPAGSDYVYFELGQALAAAGRGVQAQVLFNEALRRGCWDEDLIGEYAALDPTACLAAVEREAGFWLQAGHLLEYELGEYRAQALQALGRSQEAVQHLDAPEGWLVPAGGCVPTHITGADWMWRAWMAVEPQRLEAPLLEAVRTEYATNVRALLLLAELYDAQGEHGKLETELAAWKKHHGDESEYSEVLVALAPIRGWDGVRAKFEQSPRNSTVAWGLGDHLASQGRLEEAAEVWGLHLEEAWEADQDPEQLVESLGRAPQRLRPRLEELLVRARTRDVDAFERSDEIGTLAYAYWDLGERERAVELWREAHTLDPECGWAWNLRQVELGGDPR